MAKDCGKNECEGKSLHGRQEAIGKMKRVNSNDIAKLAGVSRSTVSRVINGYANVPEETRKKVMKVIKEQRYYPLLSGQLLTGKKVNTIGFFWVSGGNIGNDPLCSSYFMHVIDAAAAQGYLVLSCVVKNLTDKKNINYVRGMFMQGRIDAGIFIGNNNNEPLLDELDELGKIVGLFDFYHENEDRPKRITVNFERESGEKCIDYLYGLGHRKIALIDGNMERYSSVQRHESYIRGMMKHSLTIHNEWLHFGGISSESGYTAAKELLTACNGEFPTAICANNDSVAFGVYAACGEFGLHIPEDISIIGVDGHVNGNYTTPPLSTISFDFKAMFTSLVHRVIEVIDQKEGVTQNAFFPGTLVERASCKKVEG